eukprot:CAMPEP_0176397242 /NCGR_PEP_ID=MMETSP0126-20121128/44960_1 /TAXON_ID=141414 ORGANISM="Strombidinopsis acuminatum, Strain SPMC142" /NCGR_SAMPLE_ID=MMETSP0126 /ASSEMBLY_ACC=CAM_ASM_000229 /LENGTH=61 /DNA_ID=CAMNT_0017771419 /DNA_START=199 /DNA_END=384 /DNA_ORIENTATION=+
MIKTLLHIAAEQGHDLLVYYLSQSYPKLINQTDKEGNTPLHSAISNGNAQTVKFLLSLSGI